MAKDKILVDFTSVESYAGGLKKQSESFKSDLNNNGNLTSSFSSLIGSGLVPSYFSDYSNHVDKMSAFVNALSEGIMKYHAALTDIEGYAKEGDKPLEEQPENTPNKTPYNPSGITAPGNVDVPTEVGTEETIPNAVKIPGGVILESGYGKLSIYVTLAELNAVIEQILSKYGLTLADLFSGKFNPTLTDIIAQSPNLSVLISTITQMQDLVLQGYLKELSSSEVKPPLYPNVELFLKYLAASKGVPFSAILLESIYAPEIKDTLIKHKDSLIVLNDIALGNSKDIQTELNNIIYGTNKPIKDIDPITKTMLKDYLSVVALENDISLEDMLTKEQHADLAKEALESFVNKILYGQDTEIPISEIAKELEPILDENNTTIEDVLEGKDNETLTEIIEKTEDGKVSAIIDNMDDEALQDYVEEIVDNKHPTIVEKPIIKEIIKTIVINKEIIKYKTDYKTEPIINDNTKEPIVELPIEEPVQELPVEEPIVEPIEEKPVIIDDSVKEILKDNKYAPEIKETVRNNSSLGWLALLPIAGLGVIPLYSVLKNKKAKDENNDDVIYYEAQPTITKIIVNEDFSNFAISNGLTEEALLDGRSFEALTMYLSKLDNLSAVLNVLSTMKDDHLQKYLYELYSLKYEHIWSKNSIILKVIFNILTDTAKKQSSSLDTMLTNSNYVVWVKSSIIDLSQAYSKFEEDIKFNGGFVSFINNILNKTIIISEENLNLLKTYVDTNSKTEGLNQNSYLEKVANNEDKLKIFSIIKFGDGYDKYTFGFWSLLEIIEANKGNNNEFGSLTFDNKIIETSGYLELLFNSTDEQIHKVINKVLERYNINKEDLFNGSKEDLLDKLVEKAPNLVVLLSLILNFDSKKLQVYLKKLNSKNKNKFLAFLFKYLNYLANSENTTIDSLLTNVQYSDLIKSSLTDLKESIMKLYAISKKDDSILNEEINNIFFMEDPSAFGIDKITISLLKDYLSSSADKLKIGLNALLDIKNIDTLKKFLDSLIGNIIYLHFVSDNNGEKEQKQVIIESISSDKIRNDQKNIISQLKEKFNLNFRPNLKEKLMKYIKILGKDTGLTVEEYLDSKEFSNFININFENTNLTNLLYNQVLINSKASFDINQKLTNLVEKNNLNIEELLSLNGTNFIVESIIKEKNVLYTLEVLMNLEEEPYNKIIKELNLIKQNTNLKDIFVYIEEHLKRPKQISIEEYLEEKGNLKNTWMLLLKLLIMLLIVMYLFSKEEEVL